MVHCFQRAGLKLALDTGSGAVHVLSAPAYALLQNSSKSDFETNTPSAARMQCMLQQGFSQEDGEQAFTELVALAGQGLLFADDSYKEFAAQLGLAPVKAMCLHVAHDCNLRCRYCFASTGDLAASAC